MSNKLLPIIFITVLLNSCAPKLETIYPTLNDGKYDSEFPYKSSSPELERISESVQRINCTIFYKIYKFSPDEQITYKMLNDDVLKDKAASEEFGNNSLSGTAFTVSSENGAIALITCAHIVSFPDTIMVFRENPDGSTSPFVETISIRDKETIYVAGFPEGSEVELLAKDDQADIAILGKKYSGQTGFRVPVFPYPIGKSKELEWGTFVYLFGYPINYQMVTKAIVSSPNRDSQGSFLVDAVVNPGFSGGLVLAIRDGVPHFELVGMVQWVPEDEETYLAPQKLGSGKSYNTLIPYTGKAYPFNHKSIKYGITKIIPVEAIKEFLNKNRIMLKSEGYEISLRNREND
ncbi:MAG TPA: serine protease [Ignavibacteriaceae bacterium]|nr:serine protease [Ignavibacteriaceae bacterium]